MLQGVSPKVKIINSLHVYFFTIAKYTFAAGNDMTVADFEHNNNKMCHTE